MIQITRKTHNIPSTRHRKMHFVLLSMLVVLLGGLFVLFRQEQQIQITHAVETSPDVVVGPPSLPAATVDAIFTRFGSSMAGTGQVVEEASRNTNIDDAFALAVWLAETSDGMAGVGLGYHNPGGVQGSPNYPSNGYAIYPSYAAGETDWFNIVQSRYVSRGLTSVYTIANPYVGTSGASTWANKVMNYMTNYRAIAPAPTPTPTVQPTPTPIPTAAIKPRADTHKNLTSLVKDNQQQIPRPIASTPLNAMPTSTRLLLTGIGLLVALLLAVPGLLVRRKRPATGEPWTIASPLLEPEEATYGLPVTTTLHIQAITTEQLKPLYGNQYSPILESEAVHAVNSEQSAFETDMPPTVSASSPFRKSMLKPVADQGREVPPTPLQRVPATPRLQNVPATPLAPHASQNGLLTRYKAQSVPRRIELRRQSDTTNP